MPCNEERKEGSGSRRPGSIWGLSHWKTLVLEFRKGFDADYAKGLRSESVQLLSDTYPRD